MKRTFIVLLMAVMIATPCFAQEVEPDGLFSLHGTKWYSLTGIVILPFPFLFPPFFDDDLAYCFYNDEVYPNSSSRFVTNSFYMDMIVASVFMYEKTWYDRKDPSRNTTEIGFGILQPIGIGVMFSYATSASPPTSLVMMILIKVDNNWTPPPE